MIERFRPAARTIFSAVAEDPTKPMASTPGWVTSRSPTFPSPGRIETSPSGTPAPARISPRARQASGVIDGGLATTALPVASAGAMNSAAIISGKFHGVTAAHTPTGARQVSIRLPRSDDGMVWPYKRSASSALTRKRAAVSSTSPCASEWYGLPCSSVVSLARVSARASIRSATAWQSAARSYADHFRYPSNADLAAVTAAPIWSAVGTGRSARCSPVTGERTGTDSSLAGAT